MLLPKRVKCRRVHRGRMTGKATMRGNVVLAYGEYGLAGHWSRLGYLWITSTRSRPPVSP